MNIDINANKRMEVLFNRDIILDEIIMPSVADGLIKRNFKPNQFTLNERTLKVYMSRPISYKDAHGLFCTLFYDCRKAEVLYRMLCKVTFNEQAESVELKAEMWALFDYVKGNTSWLTLSRDNEWLQGASFLVEDFDLQDFIDLELSE